MLRGCAAATTDGIATAAAVHAKILFNFKMLVSPGLCPAFLAFSL